MEQANRIELSRLMRCVIGDESYCLDMSWVQTIERFDRAKVSGSRSVALDTRRSSLSANNRDADEWMQGVDGEIPVFNLAGLLHHAPNERASVGRSIVGPDQARIIVLRDPVPPRMQSADAEGRVWGLLVDRVADILEISPEAVARMPPVAVNPQAHYFSGIVRHKKEWVLLLSLRDLSSQIWSDRPYNHEPAVTEMGGTRREKDEAHADRPGRVASMSRGHRPNGKRPGQLVIFNPIGISAGEESISFGLSISQVPEVLEPLPIIPVPGAPAFVLGLVNWRGRPVPALDLSLRLNMSSDRSEASLQPSRLIIVRDKKVRTPNSDSGEHGGRVPSISPHDELLGAIPIHPSVWVTRVPTETHSSSLALPIDLSLTRAIVGLQKETLVIPHVGELLGNRELAY